MKQITKKSGFTLIELLVVIVILGILSTISVGTFRSYFAKARDAERVSAVQNIAMMIKVDSGGKGDCTVYNYTDDATCPEASFASLATLAEENDYKIPEIKNGLNYFYVYLPGVEEGDNDFFIAIGAEEPYARNGVPYSGSFVIFVDGTTLGQAKAPLCTWTNGNLESCPNEPDGRSWEIIPLSYTVAAGGTCGPTNCGACMGFFACINDTKINGISQCTFNTTPTVECVSI